MKGTIIAKEFNRMVWVNDENGAQYSCYADTPETILRKEDLSKEEQSKCMNLNEVLGDSW